MNIPEFLDLAAELELRASELYETIAGRSSDPPIASQLRKMAGEELKHANILRTGKTYYESMPDLFEALAMEEDEVREGLREAEKHRAWFLQKGTPFLQQLRTMLDYEQRFERIHLGVSVKIKDEKLRELFHGLGKGDHAHRIVLETLIGMLNGAG